MSFSFGFEGEDYSDADEELSKSTQILSIEPTDNHSPTKLLATERHELRDLLAALPATLAYTLITLDGATLPRRALWDIKHQLMAGSSDATEEADSEVVLKLMEHDDVIRGEYEGGFKTWECSLDLVEYLGDNKALLDNSKTVLEMGCGSALPALQVLKSALKRRRALKLIVQDYNLAVLQYSTIPNLFLTWVLNRQNEHKQNLQDDTLDERDVEVTERLKEDFLTALEDCGIIIECYSGAWSSAFTQAIDKVDLILASETIYERGNLPTFTAVLRQGLTGQGTALVAAKNVYFGVGGGVQEFVKELQVQKMSWSQVFANQQGVKRTIMAVKQSKE